MERQFKHPSTRFTASNEIQPEISWSWFHSKHHSPKSPQSWHNVLDLFLAHLGLEKMKCIQILPIPANIILHQWVIWAGLETVNIIHRISNISLDGDWEYSSVSVFSCGAWLELLKENVREGFFHVLKNTECGINLSNDLSFQKSIRLHQKTYKQRKTVLLRDCLFIT